MTRSRGLRPGLRACALSRSPAGSAARVRRGEVERDRECLPFATSELTAQSSQSMKCENEYRIFLRLYQTIYWRGARRVDSAVDCGRCGTLRGSEGEALPLCLGSGPAASDCEDGRRREYSTVECTVERTAWEDGACAVARAGRRAAGRNAYTPTCADGAHAPATRWQRRCRQLRPSSTPLSRRPTGS